MQTQSRGAVICENRAARAKAKELSDLLVLAFDNETGTVEMRDTPVSLQKQHIVTLDDATVVIRKQERQGQAGRQPGGKRGALGGGPNDIGVDDKFIKEVGETIEPGHSALFLLVRESTPDKLKEELGKYDAKVLQTSLSNEDEAKLQAMFGAEEIEA